MPTIWNELGIDPTSDELAIRRAYAGKLKVTQPEDDREGFQRLREAYEQAIRLSKARKRGSGRPNVPAQPPAAEVAAVHDPDIADARTEARRTLDAHGYALSSALQSDDPERWIAARDAQALILSSPLLDDLVLRSSVEMWMADQIASRMGRSDALIEPAMQFFGWNGRSYRQPSSAVAAALRRHEERRLVDAFSDPDHEWHRGWTALTRWDPTSWQAQAVALRPDVRSQVGALLQKMARYPGLRLDMNVDALAWWQRRRGASALVRIAWRLPMALALSFLGTLALPFEITAPTIYGLTVVMAIVIAAAHSLLIGPCLTRWMQRHPRLADDRIWIAMLAFLPLIVWLIPLTHTAFALPVTYAAVALGWQDSWIAASPRPLAKKGPAWKKGLLLVCLTAVAVFLGGGLGVPRFWFWIAAILPMSMLWLRGAQRVQGRLARLPAWSRRGLLAAAVIFVEGLTVLSLERNDPFLHFGSVLFAGPFLMLVLLGLALEAPTWRQRLTVPYRILIMLQVGLVIAGTPSAMP